MSDLINSMCPQRWKVFKVLPVEDCNFSEMPSLTITDKQFNEFISINKKRVGGILVPEDNERMKGSYVMVDHAGWFYDNINNAYRYSRPILSTGLAQAFNDVFFDMKKFQNRGGLYKW